MAGTAPIISPNYSFLPKRYAQIARLGTLAERFFLDDANTCLLKLRQLGEELAKHVAAQTGQFISGESQAELLVRLKRQGVIGQKMADILHGIRKTGNEANHEMVGSQREALHQLKMAHQAAIWLYRSFHRDAKFKPEPFVPPAPPADASESLTAEIVELQVKLESAHAELEEVQLSAEEHRKRRASAEYRAVQAQSDISVWQELAEEEQRARAEALEEIARLQEASIARTPAENNQVVNQVFKESESVDIDERATRILIDKQLRDAGWTVDSGELRYNRGSRPAKGKNIAIAEWPTENGPVDYALFVGLELVAMVEAKRVRKNVPAVLEQAKRYARGYKPKGDDKAIGGPWGEYKVPFLFATNGRPFLRQLIDQSGIWFIDVRRAENHGRPLTGWYSPEELKAEIEKDAPTAHQALKDEPTEYLGLRHYQLSAIKAIEEAIEKGQRDVLLAMATGTGKTRTCIGLVYRLLKTKRFRRILFLVDRTALGEQALGAFKDAQLEGLQTFAQIFDIKELKDQAPESDTKLQIATVQSMVRRVIGAEERGEPVPSVGQYDAIVVDEAHRGYLLDKEMSDVEFEYRQSDNYISTYRRVLDHFDAVKIGLTATPALHTTEIFGKPVFEYSYREAVIDGYLIDHEPPIRIITKLAEDGISWRAGENVEEYIPDTGQLNLVELEDEVNIEVDEFNTKVLTENFNKVICQELAKQIDPSLGEKTVIYCARDTHCDTVVRLLKEAFAEEYGDIEDNAVIKITGQSDKPLQLIRLYKNEKLPNVAVTVDLLTTGIDVPSICNVVFIRRVRSRILYEQMLGRATRLCPALNKEVFRIFDAVDIYQALDKYSNMKPVVVNPSFTFEQLWQELAASPSIEAQTSITEQIVAKLQRKRKKLEENEEALEAFTTLAGNDPAGVLNQLTQRVEGKQALSEGAAKWLLEHSPLAELLDRKLGKPRSLMVSNHPDEVIRTERGYGDAEKPNDYIEGFSKYLLEHMNEIPALLVVTQRPKELTREQLKELKLALDQAGYTERNLRTAWRDMTNQDIAASIIGFIRQQVLKEPLYAYEDRVDRAIKRIKASQSWTTPQLKWLDRIGKQMVQETIVDKEAMDRGEFKQQGGFGRINKVFDGKLEHVLSELHEQLWKVG